MARIEIYIPSDGVRSIVRTETLDGSAVPGIPFRILDAGESEPFEFDPETQRLVIAAKPAKEN